LGYLGDWGLGIGDWANPQSPIPNPQSPIPNPQIIFIVRIITNYEFLIIKLLNKK